MTSAHRMTQAGCEKLLLLLVSLDEFGCALTHTPFSNRCQLLDCLVSIVSSHCCTQDACDIADADHSQETLENWDKENITSLALRKVSRRRSASARTPTL